MGLFDAFSRKEEESRKALLDLLVKQCNDQHGVNAQAQAAVAARKASAVEWIAAHEQEIADGYSRLLDAFLTGEGDNVATVLRALDDVAGPVLDIPVYKDDGKSAMSFRDMAAQLFAGHTNVGFLVKRTAPGLPETAYTKKSAVDFMPALNPYKAELGESSFGTRLSGSHKQEQKDKIVLLTQTLDKLQKDGPAQEAAAKADLAQVVSTRLDAIATRVSRRHAFLQAIARGNAEGTINSLDGLADAGLRDEILALGTGHKEYKSFTALALHSYDAAADRAYVYEYFMNLGGPLESKTVLEQALDDADPLPPATVDAMLRALTEREGAAAVQALVRNTPEGESPLLVRAWNKPKLGERLLQPFADDILRAELLLDTAAQAEDKKIAAALSAQAHVLAGGDYLKIDNDTRLRIATTTAVRADGKVLRFVTSGQGWTAEMDARKAQAVIDYLAQDDNFVRMNDKALLNPAQAFNLWIADHNGDQVTMKAITAAGTESWLVPEDEVDDIMDDVEKRAGWFRAGGELVNAAHIDNLWCENLEGGQTKIALRGHDRSYFVQAAATDAAQAVTGLEAQKDKFVRIGDELFALARAGNIWVVDNDNADRPARVKVSYGDSVYHADTTHKDAKAVMQTLSRYTGFVVVGPAELININALDSAILQADEQGRGGKLRYAIGGKEHSTKFDRLEEASAVFGALKRQPGYVALSSLIALNGARFTAVQQYDKDKLSYVVSGKTWTSPSQPHKTAEFIGDLTRDKTYLKLTDSGAVRKDAADLIYYSAKNAQVSVVAQGGVTTAKMERGDAEKLMRAITGDNDKDGSGLGAIFGPEIAGPEIVTAPPAKGTGVAGAFNKAAKPDAPLDVQAKKTVKPGPVPPETPVADDKPDAAPAQDEPVQPAKRKGPPPAPWDKVLK